MRGEMDVGVPEAGLDDPHVQLDDGRSRSACYRRYADPMTTAVVVLVALVEIGAAVLLGRWARQVRAAAERPRPAVDDELDARRTSRVYPLLAVEIRNPHELAARESWAARRFGTLVPRVVGREVAARAAEQLAEQLAARGVDAEVRIVTPRSP